jgi:phosphate transport system protein
LDNIFTDKKNKMIHLEHVLQNLKKDLQDMANLVQTQLTRSRDALLHFDKSIANQVLHTEKRVNAYELKIDSLCENIVALYNPVARDMRAVFAYYKINSHLERMGDYAKNIANNVLELELRYDEQLLEDLDILTMFEIAHDMITENIVALISGNPQSAHHVFEMDMALNALHDNGIEIVVAAIKKDTEQTRALLDLASTVRRLERVGDYNTNIAEELIFCFEAKVLKHQDSSNK